MERDVIVVVGKTGQGKSLWSKLYTRSTGRGLFYDPALSFPNVEWKTDADLHRWYEHTQGITGSFPANFRIGTAFRETVDLLSDISFVAGHSHFIVEECHTVFYRGQILPEWAQRQIFYGRHTATTIVFISQRASSLPIDIRSQATRVISFLQTEPADLDWLSNAFGRDTARGDVPELEPLECIDHWNGQIKRYSIRSQVDRLLNIKVDTRRASVLDSPNDNDSHLDLEDENDSHLDSDTHT